MIWKLNARGSRKVLVKTQWLNFVSKRLVRQILAVNCVLLFELLYRSVLSSFTTTLTVVFQVNIALSHNSIVLLGKVNYMQC